MRKLALLSLLLLLSWVPGRSQSVWLPSYEDALREAQRLHRPILLLQMFGRLDEDFC